MSKRSISVRIFIYRPMYWIDQSRADIETGSDYVDAKFENLESFELVDYSFLLCFYFVSQHLQGLTDE